MNRRVEQTRYAGARRIADDVRVGHNEVRALAEVNTAAVVLNDAAAVKGNRRTGRRRLVHVETRALVRLAALERNINEVDLQISALDRHNARFDPLRLRSVRVNGYAVAVEVDRRQRRFDLVLVQVLGQVDRDAIEFVGEDEVEIVVVALVRKRAVFEHINLAAAYDVVERNRLVVLVENQLAVGVFKEAVEIVRAVLSINEDRLAVLVEFERAGFVAFVGGNKDAVFGIDFVAIEIVLEVLRRAVLVEYDDGIAVLVEDVDRLAVDRLINRFVTDDYVAGVDRHGVANIDLIFEPGGIENLEIPVAGVGVFVDVFLVIEASALLRLLLLEVLGEIEGYRIARINCVGIVRARFDIDGAVGKFAIVEVDFDRLAERNPVVVRINDVFERRDDNGGLLHRKVRFVGAQIDDRDRLAEVVHAVENALVAGEIDVLVRVDRFAGFFVDSNDNIPRGVSVRGVDVRVRARIDRLINNPRFTEVRSVERILLFTGRARIDVADEDRRAVVRVRVLSLDPVGKGGEGIVRVRALRARVERDGAVGQTDDRIVHIRGRAGAQTQIDAAVVHDRGVVRVDPRVAQRDDAAVDRRIDRLIVRDERINELRAAHGYDRAAETVRAVRRIVRYRRAIGN